MKEERVVIMGPEGPIQIPQKHPWNRYDLGMLSSCNISPFDANKEDNND